MPEPSLPSIAILAAPGSLLLSGYINSFSDKNNVVLYLLFILSIVFYIIVLGYLPKLLRLPFIRVLRIYIPYGNKCNGYETNEWLFN